MDDKALAARRSMRAAAVTKRAPMMNADSRAPGAKSGPSGLSRMTGHAHVSFGVKDGATRLATLDQASPLRVLFPRAEAGEPPLAAIAVVSGGIVGGDRLNLSVAVSENAKAMALGQAAEKVYRSAGPDSAIDIVLAADAGSWLEHLPQETILFDGARLVRRTRIEIAGTGRVLAGEMPVFGRLERRESVRRGHLGERWEVRRGGRLVWADSLLVDGDICARMDAPSGFGGARSSATVLYAGPDGERYLDMAKALTTNTAGARAGASLVHGVLIARWLSADPLALRRSLERYWTAMRHAAGGLPARLPRLWHI